MRPSPRRDLHARDAADPRAESYARLLYEQAVIAEGSTVADPVAFARKVNELIARDAAKLPQERRVHTPYSDWATRLFRPFSQSFRPIRVRMC